MKKKKVDKFILERSFNYNYEEDVYDRLKYIEKNRNDFYTNRSKMKRPEYDYEEDAYEPEIEE